jgi:hypothetical protein
MTELPTEAKVKLAKQAATVMFSTMAGVPPEIQIEASIILMQSLFISHTKSTHRMSLFRSVVKKMTVEIRKSLQPNSEAKK